MTAAEYKALGTQKKPATSPARPTQGKTQPAAEPGKSKEREPAEKHVCLPPSPPDAGPWMAGRWTIRRTTTYEPAARVAITGPSEDFDHFLNYLQAYQP